MYNNIDNMYFLFNTQNLYNINVENCRLLNVDTDHNHDFQLPNSIKVDPNGLMINPLSASTFSCLSLDIFSYLKKHFRHCFDTHPDCFSIIFFSQRDFFKRPSELAQTHLWLNGPPYCNRIRSNQFTCR